MILKIASNLGDFVSKPPSGSPLTISTKPIGTGPNQIPGMKFEFTRSSTAVMSSSCAFNIKTVNVNNTSPVAANVGTTSNSSNIPCSSSTDDTNAAIISPSSVKNLLYLLNKDKISLDNITSTWSTSNCQVTINTKDCSELTLVSASGGNPINFMDATSKMIVNGATGVISIPRTLGTIDKAFILCNDGNNPVQVNLNNAQLDSKILFSETPNCQTNINEALCNANQLMLTEKGSITDGTQITFGGNIGSATCNQPISIDAINDGLFKYNPVCFQDASSNWCVKWTTFNIAA